jgi:predicted enzyme related to lactoylglutathione lyase
MIKDALVTIGASDFDRTVEFYRLLIDRSPQPFIPASYAEFAIAGGLRLGIFLPAANHRSEFADSLSSGLSICLEVGSIATVLDLLSHHGYPTSGEIVAASHGREIYIYDPSGNRLILHQQHQTS